MYCWFDPGLLKPQNIAELIEFQNDDGTVESISVEQLQVAFRENSGLFQLLDDIETGSVHFSFEEYQRLPAKFQDIRRMYSRFKTKAKEN